jgi:hypothetical protein
VTPELRHFTGLVFHGVWELLSLFILLWLAAWIMGWVTNRSLRPAERSAPVNSLALICSFALLILLKRVPGDHLHLLIVSGAMVITAIIAASSGTRRPVLPLMVLGALLGLGLNLSALVLVITSVLVLLFTRPRSK